MELGHPRTDLRRSLVDAVLRGEKTATAGLLADYELEGEQLPQVGERWALLDYDDKPVAVVAVTAVQVVRVGDVDLAFARDEGEGFTSVDDWRLAHEAFWAGHRIFDDTLIVALRFRVIDRP